MRRAAIAITALVAVGGLAAVAASGLAGSDEPGLEIARDRELQRLAVAPADPDAAASVSRTADRSARRGRPRQRIEYFQTQNPLEVAAHSEEAATLRCPKGYRALGGYYVTGRPGTFLDLSAPDVSVDDSSGADTMPARDSKRNWVIGVFNDTDAADQVVLGVTCLNKVR